MRELRLAPAALLMWACTWLTIYFRHPGWAVLLLSFVVLAAYFKRAIGQIWVLSSLGSAAAILSWWRCYHAWNLRTVPGEISGKLATAAKKITTVKGPETWLLRLKIPSQPEVITVFLKNPKGLIPLDLGTPVVLKAQWSAAEKLGLSQVVGSSQQIEVGKLSGWAAWVSQIRSGFRQSSEAFVGPSGKGLIPGMVLGDTSLQTPAEFQAYIATGLSHLCAVSGANVAILSTALVLVALALGFSPRAQIATALSGIAVFFLLVGPEPSVLRASVTGVVGLCAVLGSATMPAAHGLSLAIIGLLLWDSDLACQWGFALSVCATAGIIGVYPLIFSTISTWALKFRSTQIIPVIIWRALAVSIAADMVTMPLIAAMTGKVSLVAILANMLVAPVVGVVTVVGLIAVLLSLIPGNLEWLPLQIIRPATWWIFQVAQYLSKWRLATINASPLWAILGYGWTLWVLWMLVQPRMDNHATGPPHFGKRQIPGRTTSSPDHCPNPGRN
ncbi:ComEC/Rec2 family competence protein [Corynebacterium caspium]|uniref:ComEC/Rec2 family competence protein n=1 Tax=Corynebacterium caspium TaxID=234828 RepID=UPI00068647B4|nr:ComEC/Rec2 family competence protein [Corynebacterium caspium]WKD58859.1 Competence protein [Corynebacterium caspium DSM 44850]